MPQRLAYCALAIVFSTQLQASEITSFPDPENQQPKPINSRDLEIIKNRINRGFSRQDRLLENQSTETIKLRNQVNEMSSFLQNLDALLAQGIAQLHLMVGFLVTLLLAHFFLLRKVKKIIQLTSSKFETIKKITGKGAPNALGTFKNSIRIPIIIANMLRKKMNKQNFKRTVAANLSIENIEVIKLEPLSKNVLVIEEEIEANSSKSLLIKRGLSENLRKSEHVRRKIKCPRPKKQVF